MLDGAFLNSLAHLTDAATQICRCMRTHMRACNNTTTTTTKKYSTNGGGSGSGGLVPNQFEAQARTHLHYIYCVLRAHFYTSVHCMSLVFLYNKYSKVPPYRTICVITRYVLLAYVCVFVHVFKLRFFRVLHSAH